MDPLKELEKLWDVVMEMRGMLKAHLNEHVTGKESKHLSSPFKGKVIYLAGKFTGHIDDIVVNTHVARDYASKLADKGHCIIVPHINFDHFGLDLEGYRKAMACCLTLIHRVDAVFFMPGWKDSLGATAEWYAAHALFRTVYYELDDVPDVTPKSDAEDI